MGAAKFLLPVLSVATSALAASCSASTTTVGNDGFGSCSTFTGNVVVATGSADGGAFSFGSVEKIDGDLTYQNDPTVQTISATSLSEVTGELTFANMSQLGTSGLGSLKTAGSLTFNGLASLSDLGLTALKEVGMVSIVNTNAQDLSGISNVTKIDGLSVSDNQFLGSISLDVSEIGIIEIGPNDNNGQTADFSSLETADTIIIRNCTSVSLGALGNCTNALELLGNTFKSFAAPNLTSAGGVVLNNNIALTNISFPELTQIKSKNATFQIANNTKLNTIGGFPLLKTVTGGVTFSGNFSKVEFDSISSIAGALVVDTAASNFDCDPITALKNKVVKGKDTCKTGDKTKVGGSSSGTESGDASATSSGFASPMEIPASFMSGFAVLAGMLSMVL